MRTSVLGASLLLSLAVACAAAAEVWCPDPLEPILEGIDYTGKNDPKCAVRIAGTRGGAFSAQVVLHAKGGMKGPEAKVSALTHEDGNRRRQIPASSVEIRYALPSSGNGSRRLPKGQSIFDALGKEPRAEGTTHPVWLTVNVPRDAAPGEYEGTLTVAGREVSVKLAVCGWTLPPAAEFTTFVDFIESPESVALQYKVPLWSDEHFKLLGTCFRELAKVGNKTIYLTLICQGNLGNEQSIVRWTKDGEALKPDLTAAKRYIDTILESGCRPQVVVLYLFESKMGGGRLGTTDKGKDKGTDEEKQRGGRITVLDPETQTLTTVEGPCLNSRNAGYPNYPEDTVAFWKPVLEGLREHLAKKGVGEETMMLGLFPDFGRPAKPVVECLKKAAPYVRWVDQTHGAMKAVHGVEVGYVTTVWNARFPKDPGEARTYGWRNSRLVTQFARDLWKPAFVTQLMRGRLLGEWNITGKQRGFGRMGADFWPVLEGKRGRRRSLSSRYRMSDWHQLNLRVNPYIAPGPAGALGTVRFEMLREGVQECEARIFIERALLDEGQRAKLGDELAKKCQDLLDERVRVLRKTLGGRNNTKEQEKNCTGFIGSGWRERSKALFSAAAEVQRKLAGP